jgi:hypothetical protein
MGLPAAEPESPLSDSDIPDSPTAVSGWRIEYWYNGALGYAWSAAPQQNTTDDHPPPLIDDPATDAQPDTPQVTLDYSSDSNEPSALDRVDASRDTLLSRRVGPEVPITPPYTPQVTLDYDTPSTVTDFWSRWTFTDPHFNEYTPVDTTI